MRCKVSLLNYLCSPKIETRNEMATNINTKELKEILEIMPDRQNIMLVGKHGIGKSEILTDFFEKKGMKVTTLFLGQMSDPGDLIGLPRLDETTGKTMFMPPYWFPTNGKPIVLFLDELNRARPEVLQTIMDLALNRKLAGRNLPEGSRIVSAVNEGEEYQLTDLDPALVSRFNIYNFRPTVAEWLLWAAEQKVDERVITFIQENPRFLDTCDRAADETGLDKTPDRRAWKKVSDNIKDFAELKPVHKKIISGIVGAQATTAFMSSISQNRILSAKEILMDYEKHKTKIEKYMLHETAVVNESIFRFLETHEFTDDEKPTIAQNLALYVKGLQSPKKKEEFAHFVSIYEKGAYTQAIVFILTETPELYTQMTSFIKNL